MTTGRLYRAGTVFERLSSLNKLSGDSTLAGLFLKNLSGEQLDSLEFEVITIPTGFLETFSFFYLGDDSFTSILVSKSIYRFINSMSLPDLYYDDGLAILPGFLCDFDSPT